ncbi:flagellar export chaperone FliS [Demequina mangrovi]|uniref:Flagellar protein FliS n=1 Tax=Demequina mangrovi TaxID=1043493 RepID=A0A1H6ZW19_9MICO|nr:flagellar export chaperone FliS [Demequina mangrovi]SEJ56394.1 flagellar protein FliS [Demequina mangrovi]
MQGYAAARNRYLKDAVTTATPGALLVMLYDRLALDLERAELAIGAGDRAEASAQLLHAQQIVAELTSTLDVEAWDGAPRLMALYVYVSGLLIEANIGQDAEKVGECRRIVEPLRDTWRQVAQGAVAAAADHLAMTGVA